MNVREGEELTPVDEVPAGQVVHEEAPFELEKVPDGQEEQDVAPADEYDPGEQALHDPLDK